MLCYIYLRIPYTFCGFLYTSCWSCLPPTHLRTEYVAKSRRRINVAIDHAKHPGANNRSDEGE